MYDSIEDIDGRIIGIIAEACEETVPAAFPSLKVNASWADIVVESLKDRPHRAYSLLTMIACNLAGFGLVHHFPREGHDDWCPEFARDRLLTKGGNARSDKEWGYSLERASGECRRLALWAYATRDQDKRAADYMYYIADAWECWFERGWEGVRQRMTNLSALLLDDDSSLHNPAVLGRAMLAHVAPQVAAHADREAREGVCDLARFMQSEGYPVTQIAEAFGVTRPTVYDWVRSARYV